MEQSPYIILVYIYLACLGGVLVSNIVALIAKDIYKAKRKRLTHGR